MIVKILTDQEESLFKNYVASNLLSNIYHTIEWRDILNYTYGFKPLYLIAIKHNRIQGVLPFFKTFSFFGKQKLICLPYTHMVSPLYSNQEAYNALINEAHALAKAHNIDYLMIKSDLNINQAGWFKLSNNFITTLNLHKDANLVKSRFKNSVLRNIKKAQRENIEIKKIDSINGYRAFYNLMVETRHRQGAPPYSKKFFDLLYKKFDCQKRCLFEAFKGNRLLSGIILLYSRSRAIYAYGASVSDPHLMRCRPNELLFWTAIQDSCQKGYSVFDLGITPEQNSGLLHFKTRWGGITFKLSYSCFANMADYTKLLYKRNTTFFRIASNFLQITPRPLFKSVGPVLLKYFGY